MTPSKPARDMTMREHIAAQCMAALLSTGARDYSAPTTIIETVLDITDMLIAELGKTEQTTAQPTKDEFPCLYCGNLKHHHIRLGIDMHLHCPEGLPTTFTPCP